MVKGENVKTVKQDQSQIQNRLSLLQNQIQISRLNPFNRKLNFALTFSI
jgi:hypothetical protein